MVLDVHQSLPAALAAEGVGVVLDESVDEVHGSESVLHPLDVVLVPEAQVAGAVVFDQSGDVLLLEVVLGDRGGFSSSATIFSRAAE